MENNFCVKNCPQDILLSISEYLNDKQDFMNLALCSKSLFYNLILSNERRALNKLFKNIIIFNLNNIPNYIKINLKYLNFKNNEKLNSNFNSFVNLKKLFIEFTTNNEMSLNENYLQNLIKLKILHLKNCKSITGKCFTTFPNLKELNLINTDIKKEKYLQNLTFLTSLTLNTLNKNISNYLKYLQNLKILNISYIPLNRNNEMLPKSLKYLTVNICEITDDQIKHLINLVYLNIHSIYSEQVTGTCLQYLNNLETLIINNDDYDDTFDGENLRYLKKLKELQIWYCSNVKYFYKNLNTIEKLFIHSCENISDESLQYLNNLKEFIFLEDFPAKKFTGSCLQNFTKLKYLELNILINHELLKECKELKYFKLHTHLEIEDN
ncbi:hypothetical protein ABK040_012515 [Willaertia magna]